MAAALAVRLALLKELSEVNIAFFDEPTTNMDEERRRNLAQQIGRIKDFHQLFVISHDDSFEGYTDQVILLGERETKSGHERWGHDVLCVPEGRPRVAHRFNGGEPRGWNRVPEGRLSLAARANSQPSLRDSLAVLTVPHR